MAKLTGADGGMHLPPFADKEMHALVHACGMQRRPTCLAEAWAEDTA